MITVSLPADTHLPLVAGQWAYTENMNTGELRILASYTEEEAEIVVGMMEVSRELQQE